MDALDRFRIHRVREHDGPTADRYRYRPRSYDLAVLRYVAYFRVVTAHQVAYRFFVYAGKGPKQAFAVLRRLADEGLLARHRLDPDQGAASRHVVTITPLGWHVLGLRPKPSPRTTTHSHLREYRLQFADVLLERESQGWRFVPAPRSFAVLQQWALGHYRGRLLNASEIAFRDRIERMPDPDLLLHVMVQPRADLVRLLLPLRPGKSFRHTIDHIPNLSVLPPLHFETVCSEPELLVPATRYLHQWATAKKTAIQVHSLPHFRTRPSPYHPSVRPEDRYRHNGTRTPLDMV